MNLQLFFEYPSWFLVLCFALGGIYAGILYFRPKHFGDPDTTLRRWMMVMAGLRFLSVSILAILLLAPFLKLRSTEEIKPIVVYLQDASESIVLGVDSNELKDFSDRTDALIADLEENYQVDRYSFGGGLNAQEAWNWKERSTDISAALSELSERYFNKNVGAVVLASDGIYNQGVNPVYEAGESGFPIYTIGLGDTSKKRDAKVESVRYNKIAYLGDKFQIEIDLQFNKLSSRPSRLRVLHYGSEGTETQFEQELESPSKDGVLSYSAILEAPEAGMRHYAVVLDPIDGEFSSTNNRYDLYVDVLDGRKRILLLARAPHPDISAIRQSIASSDNYELDVAFLSRFDGSLTGYNLLIAHQLPSGDAREKAIFSKIKEARLPVWFITGSGTNYGPFNQAQGLVQISQQTSSLNAVQGSFNDDFDLFELDVDMKDKLRDLPPVSAVFGSYKMAANAQVLMWQKIGSVVSEDPLFLLMETVDARMAIFAGDGLWRWRLNDHLQNGSHLAFDGLLSKLIQFLSVKEDRRPFKAFPDRNLFSENEGVRFQAQLYNASYEAVNEAQVDLRVTHADGTEYDYVFEPKDGSYQLDLGFLPPGNYTYRARTTYKEEQLAATGTFGVQSIQLEGLELEANHQLLYQLAEQSGGEMIAADKIAQITDKLSASDGVRTILYETFKTHSVIHLKWIFFLILLLLSAEWFLRRYQGAY